MKLRWYKLLFRLFSFLSNKTEGASFFVRYKLLLGTIIIGLTGTSCASRQVQHPTCYDMSYVPENDSLTIPKDTANAEPLVKIMCYVQISVPKEQSKADSK